MGRAILVSSLGSFSVGVDGACVQRVRRGPRSDEGLDLAALLGARGDLGRTGVWVEVEGSHGGASILLGSQARLTDVAVEAFAPLPLLLREMSCTVGLLGLMTVGARFAWLLDVDALVEVHRGRA